LIYAYRASSLLSPTSANFAQLERYSAGRIHTRDDSALATPCCYRASPHPRHRSCHSTPSHLSDPELASYPAQHASSLFFLYSSTMAVSASRVTSALRIAGRRYPALRAATPIQHALTCDQSRSFASSPRWKIRTKEMNDDLLKDLKVNQGRLMEDIHHTCQWGTGERWGQYAHPCVTRLSRADYVQVLPLKLG
jgi:hypothetical protein